MNTKGLLPIGQFAQASGLTVIALRHYDATGVLPPATVDPSSGYRYYEREQVPTAQLVRLLRQVDVPVDQLPELLTRIEAGADVLPELAASLDRRTGDGEEFGRAAYEKLYLAASRGPLTLPSPAFVRYNGRLTHTEPVQVDACLPYWLGGAEPRDLPHDVVAQRHPAGRFAGLRVHGAESAFPAIMTAYDVVAEWITAHGFEFDGPPEEIYQRWCGKEGHPDNILEVGWWITD